MPGIMKQSNAPILDEQTLISPLEASKMFGVSRQYIYRLIKMERLACTTEQPVRITMNSLKRYLRKREAKQARKARQE
jgi:predicted DNA-binding transcriptional regulator AlpA